MPAISKALTSKQAKAAFKARGRPTLSEKESRQLERALELERRAEAAKEAEKRRAEAAKKRAEKDKVDARERDKDRLGTQRRKDRFGFKASQFHLGAFFGKQNEKKPEETVLEDDEDEESFGDDDLDDEVLLSALDVPTPEVQAADRTNVSMHPMSDTALMPPPPLPRSGASLQRSKTESSLDMGEDLDSFWDDLDSSTQIARELDTGTVNDAQPREVSSESFSSGDFDLTAEDLDELDPPKPSVAASNVPAQRTMLPPPAPPLPQWKPQNSFAPNAAYKNLVSATNSKPHVVSKPTRMPPPVQTASASKPTPSSNSVIRASANAQKPQNAIRGPFLRASSLYCSPDHGFTLSQLETFIDDDIQLTQAIPG